jgi:hypothetical protein
MQPFVLRLLRLLRLLSHNIVVRWKPCPRVSSIVVLGAIGTALGMDIARRSG